MQLKRSDSEVWSRALSDGGVAVLLLNRNPSEAQEIEADFNLVCIYWLSEDVKVDGDGDNDDDGDGGVDGDNDGHDIDDVIDHVWF